MTALLNNWMVRVAALAVGLAVVGVVGYTRLAAAPARPELRTAPVQRANVTQTVSVSGAINPSAQVRLNFKSGGRLAEVLVSAGQEVQPGQPLARLDDTDQRISLAQAEANLASAQAKYAIALAGDDIASLRLSVDNAQRTLDRLVANYNAAKTNLEVLYQKATGDRDSAAANVALANATLATLQQELSSATAQSTDVKNASSSASTVQTNLQQAQLQLALLDTAFADLRSATSALRAEIDRADAGSPDVQAFAAAQTAHSASLARAQGAVDAAGSPLAAAVTNGNAVLASLNATGTKADAGLDSARADAAALVQQVGTAQQHLTRSKSTLGGLSGAASTITDAITGSSIANAQNSLATAKQSLQAKLNSRNADLLTALSAAQSAQAAVENARNALANTVLAAPARGVVAQLNAQPGEFVGGGTSANPLVLLSTTGALVLHGTIGEADVARLQVGQVATVTVDAIGTDRRLTGRVTNIDPQASIQQGVPVYGVDITLALEEPAIRAGMSGTASVIVASKRDVLVVPNLAIRNLGGRRGVQVLREGQAVDVTEVRFGIANEQVTEVLAGLEEGELVVLPTARAGATPAGGIRFGPPPGGGGGPGSGPGPGR